MNWVAVVTFIVGVIVGGTVAVVLMSLLTMTKRWEMAINNKDQPSKGSTIKIST